MIHEKEIGERLADLRKERNLTQNRLADMLFLQRGQIAKWEAGESVPKVEYIIKYADFFDTTCDYILRGYTPENSTVIKDLGLSETAIEILKTSKTQVPMLVRLIDYFLAIWPKREDSMRSIGRAIDLGIHQKKKSASIRRAPYWKYAKTEIFLDDGTVVYTNEIIEALKSSVCNNLYNLVDGFVDAEVCNAKEENDP